MTQSISLKTNPKKRRPAKNAGRSDQKLKQKGMKLPRARWVGEKISWAGLAIRRPIKSLCRARSTPFYLIQCERRASQVQLGHLLREVSLLTGALSFVVLACVCHGQLVSREHITQNEPAPRVCAILPHQFWGLARAVGAFLKTGSPCRVCPCWPPPDQLSQWARGGLSVVSLGHALTFQSLANLALANNNYTNRKEASKPPPNHTVIVCRLGIVFQPSRQSTQPETQSYRIAKRPTSDLVPAA